MTEIYAGQNNVTCQEATAYWDDEVNGVDDVDEVNDILSDEQRQAISQHIEECPACSEFTMFTGGLLELPEQMLTEDELNDAISNVMGKARDYRQKRRSQKRIWAGIAAVAASVVLGILISLILSNGISPVNLLPCTPTTPEALASGVYMSYCTPHEPVTLVEKDGDVRVTMQYGTVGLSINPHREIKQAVIVSTPFGDVQVKGTVFTVHVENGSVWVEVFRGIVQIKSASNDTKPFAATAGHRAVLPSGELQTLTQPRSEKLREVLSQVKYEQLAASGSHINENSYKTAKQTSPFSNITAAAPAIRNAESSDHHKTADATQSLGAEPRGRKTPIYTAPSMQMYIEEAQACMIDQNWNCAAKKYQSALSRFPQRPESSTVLIGLAKIELRHLNAPQKALTHYQQYLQKAPNGPLAEEAHQGIIASYRKLGRTADEQNSLRTLIARYPGSSYAPKARTRLKQLQSVSN